jgi:hypothetical protein
MKPSFLDGFAKNPISALRFIPLSLRRTARTPHSAGLARLELGLFTKPSVRVSFYESIFLEPTANPPEEGGPGSCDLFPMGLQVKNKRRPLEIKHAA